MNRFFSGDWLAKLLVLVGVSLLTTSQLAAQDNAGGTGITVLGSIRLPDDKPAMGSKVYLLKTEDGWYPLPTRPRVTESDHSGKYRFDNVAPGGGNFGRRQRNLPAWRIS